MGCSLECQAFSGWYCEDNHCETRCSDSITAGEEECDPTADFELMEIACTDQCKIDPNYACDESSGVLACRSLCANGEIDGTE